MSMSQVETTVLNEPLVAVGKMFRGDYARSREYILEVQRDLQDSGARFVPNKVIGVYYDNPQEKGPDELASFQGVFLLQDDSPVSHPLTMLKLQGRFLHVRVCGDPLQSILAGYAALFGHIQRNRTPLKSPAGHQISTFEDGVVTTDIYMEIAEE